MGLGTIVPGAIDSVSVCDFQYSEDALTAILPSAIDSFRIWEMTGAVFVFEPNCFDGIAFELIWLSSKRQLIKDGSNRVVFSEFTDGKGPQWQSESILWRRFI